MIFEVITLKATPYGIEYTNTYSNTQIHVWNKTTIVVGGRPLLHVYIARQTAKIQRGLCQDTAN